MRKFLIYVAACLPLLGVAPVGAAEIAAGGAESVSAGAAYVPSAENVEARTEFQDAKFGIFLHWGLYSMLGTGEWTMTNRDMNYREYQKLANAFYPHDFDAAEWVSAIKDSGAKYICFTTRHHEGFRRVPQAGRKAASLLFAYRLVARRLPARAYRSRDRSPRYGDKL